MRFQLLKNDYIDFNHPFTKKFTRVYRIISLKEFEVQGRTVKEYEIGGYIQDEGNLSHDDNSWVFNLGKVFGNAKLLKNAIVTDNAAVFDQAIVKHSHIKDWARVYQASDVTDSIIAGKSDVYGRAKIIASDVMNSARVQDAAVVQGSYIYGGSFVKGISKLENCQIKDVCEITDSKLINCQLSGRTIAINENWINKTLNTQIDIDVVWGDLHLRNIL